MIKIQKSVKLLPFNTFRVDAATKYFTVLKNPGDVLSLFSNNHLAGEKKFILGEGANILLVGDYPGLVIKNHLKGIKVISENKTSVIVGVASGENWHRLVMWSVENGLSGLENMAFIPGTVGGAIVGNIAAYGQNFEDVLIEVYVVDHQTGKKEIFKKKDCQFIYRDSGFKHQLKDKYFVESVIVRLSKRKQYDTNYHGRFAYESLTRALKDLGKKPPFTPLDIAQGVIAQRLIKLPDWRKIGTAGSMFKNPLVNAKKLKELKMKISELQYYPADKLGYQIHNWDKGDIPSNQVKIPAGRLLDELGWRGKRVGRVGTHDRQALCVVNFGGASGGEILEFTSKMHEDCLKNFGINLDYEVMIVGMKKRKS